MTTDVLILGAGVTGLTAGRVLQDNGKKVLLLDKGRGVGGRVATRWKGTREDIQGRWDHGAQFATFRSPALMDQLKKWGAWDLMAEWLPSYSDASIKRRRPVEGMNAFAKALAAPLQVHRSQRVTKLYREGSTWVARTENGDTFEGRKVLSTIPMPQFLDVIESSKWDLAETNSDRLHDVRYDRCLSLLAEAEESVSIENKGYARIGSGVLENVIGHEQKGISASPTFTANATSAFSLEWYDRDRATAASVMRAALQEFLDTGLVSVQIHGWKFAKPIQRIQSPYLQLDNGCVVAGDGFKAGDDDVDADLHPRIESAMLSGLHAGTFLS